MNVEMWVNIKSPGRVVEMKGEMEMDPLHALPLCEGVRCYFSFVSLRVKEVRYYADSNKWLIIFEDIVEDDNNLLLEADVKGLLNSGYWEVYREETIQEEKINTEVAHCLCGNELGPWPEQAEVIRCDVCGVELLAIPEKFKGKLYMENSETKPRTREKVF